MNEIRDARLVLTHTRTMWHIALPTTPYYTLCGVESRRRGLDGPKFSDVCKRCQRAFDWEMAS